MEVTVLERVVSGPVWFTGEASLNPKDLHQAGQRLPTHSHICVPNLVSLGSRVPDPVEFSDEMGTFHSLIGQLRLGLDILMLLNSHTSGTM